MGNKFISELAIMTALIIVVMLVLGVLLYDFIPTKKELPETIVYTADSSVTAVKQEISADNTGTGSSNNFNEATSLLKSYSVGKSDLKNYESKNAFESGKSDPFSDYAGVDSSTSGNTGSTNTTTNTVTNAATGSNSQSGTFFEKPNSK